MKKLDKARRASGRAHEFRVAAHTRDALSAHHERTPHDALIRARAYEIYLERGDGPGDDKTDWAQAEREYQRGVG